MPDLTISRVATRWIAGAGGAVGAGGEGDTGGAVGAVGEGGEEIKFLPTTRTTTPTKATEKTVMRNFLTGYILVGFRNTVKFLLNHKLAIPITLPSPSLGPFRGYEGRIAVLKVGDTG